MKKKQKSEIKRYPKKVQKNVNCPKKGKKINKKFARCSFKILN